MRRESSIAISAAGSKPRQRSRSGAGGTGTSVPESAAAGARAAIRSAIGLAAALIRPNFSALTRSRATASWGAAEKARSRPGGGLPSSGPERRRPAAHPSQITARARQGAAQATHRGGVSSLAIAAAASIAASLAPPSAREARNSLRNRTWGF